MAAKPLLEGQKGRGAVQDMERQRQDGRVAVRRRMGQLSSQQALAYARSLDHCGMGIYQAPRIMVMNFGSPAEVIERLIAIAERLGGPDGCGAKPALARAFLLRFRQQGASPGRWRVSKRLEETRITPRQVIESLVELVEHLRQGPDCPPSLIDRLADAAASSSEDAGLLAEARQAIVVLRQTLARNTTHLREAQRVLTTAQQATPIPAAALDQLQDGIHQAAAALAPWTPDDNSELHAWWKAMAGF